MNRWGLVALAGVVALATATQGSASPADGVAPVEQYTTAKAKSLATTYQSELLRFSEHIYHCLPWVGVMKDGIAFRQPKGTQGDERYLSVWIAIDQADDGGRFAAQPIERRVSAMFSRYGVDMLRRMTRLGGIASDANVQGFSVVLTWFKADTATSSQPINETLALFIDKASLRDFLARRLSSSEFAQRATFNVFEGKDPVGRVPLEVWEDNFNSTFKLKNYELAKGQKC
jgi:hypothetical protein